MLFILYFIYFVSHMSEFDALFAVEGHFEHNYSKMPSVKRNRTLRFLNDLELCTCLVWVT